MKGFPASKKPIYRHQIPHLDQNVTIQQLKSQNEFLKKQLQLLMNQSYGLKQIQLQNRNTVSRFINKVHYNHQQAKKCNQQNDEEFYRSKMEKLKNKKVLRHSSSRDKKRTSLDHQKHKIKSRQTVKLMQNIVEPLHLKTEEKQKMHHSPPKSPKSIVYSQKSEYPSYPTQIGTNQSQKTILPLVSDPRIMPMIFSKDKNGRIYRQKELEQTINNRSTHKRTNSDFSKQKSIKISQPSSVTEVKMLNLPQKIPQIQSSSPIKKIITPKKCSNLRSNVYFDHIELQDMQKQAEKMLSHLQNPKQMSDMSSTQIRCFGASNKNIKQQQAAPKNIKKRFSGFLSDGAEQSEDSVALQIKEVQRTGKKKLNYNIYLKDEQETQIKH